MASAIAAARLPIPNVPHVDDHRGVEGTVGVDPARDTFVGLHGALTLQLQPSKAMPKGECRGEAPVLLVLGSDVDVRTAVAERIGGLVCRVDLAKVKADKYERQIDRMLETKLLSPAVAGTMRRQVRLAGPVERSVAAAGWAEGDRRLEDHRSDPSCLHRFLHHLGSIGADGSGSQLGGPPSSFGICGCFSTKAWIPSWRHCLGTWVVHVVFSRHRAFYD